MTTDINSRNARGQTQLNIAADAGNVAEVARLLALKADADIADNNGSVNATPRHAMLRILNERLIG